MNSQTESLIPYYFDNLSKPISFFSNHNVDPYIIATVGVFLFGVVFNFSRWFELELLEIEDPINGNKTIQKVQVRYYVTIF